jgi:hypothetical protein
MDLVTALFSIARQISDSDLNEINKLEEKAKSQISTYHDEMKGFKGMYVKMHKGWIFQLGLIFSIPFIVNYFTRMKSDILTNQVGQNEDHEDYEDDDEEALYEELKRKYQ